MYIHVTAGLDISAGSVRLGINCPPVFCNPSDLRRLNKSMSTKSRKFTVSRFTTNRWIQDRGGEGGSRYNFLDRISQNDRFERNIAYYKFVSLADCLHTFYIRVESRHHSHHPWSNLKRWSFNLFYWVCCSTVPSSQT